MPGHVILSHGSNSGPEATKVTALAQVAAALGWTTSRPDFRGEDALGLVASVAPRIDRLVTAMRAAPRPLLLVGSSMGAFVSGLASLSAPCDGVFLIALPVVIPEYPQRFDVARGVPGMLVHGYADEVCPFDMALGFARQRGMPALALDGDHRLANQVPVVGRAWRAFLESRAA